MHKYLKIAAACGMGLASLLALVKTSAAQQSPITAIDIALEPDTTMVRRAQADNARLLKAYPSGFTLDATHHPHLSMLQQFVRTADLDKVYAAADRVLAKQRAANWKLRAIRAFSGLTESRAIPFGLQS